MDNFVTYIVLTFDDFHLFRILVINHICQKMANINSKNEFIYIIYLFHNMNIWNYLDLTILCSLFHDRFQLIVESCIFQEIVKKFVKRYQLRKFYQ